MIFAIESAMDELAAGLGIDPFEFRRRNVVRVGDHLLVTDPDEEEDLLSAATASTSAPGAGALDRGRERSRDARPEGLRPDRVIGEGWRWP